MRGNDREEVQEEERCLQLPSLPPLTSHWSASLAAHPVHSESVALLLLLKETQNVHTPISIEVHPSSEHQGAAIPWGGGRGRYKEGEREEERERERGV